MLCRSDLQTRFAEDLHSAGITVRVDRMSSDTAQHPNLALVSELVDQELGHHPPEVEVVALHLNCEVLSIDATEVYNSRYASGLRLPDTLDGGAGRERRDNNGVHLLRDQVFDIGYLLRCVKIGASKLIVRDAVLVLSDLVFGLERGLICVRRAGQTVVAVPDFPGTGLCELAGFDDRVVAFRRPGVRKKVDDILRTKNARHCKSPGHRQRPAGLQESTSFH
ncbi:hypothetical protein D3C80_1254520 [compost metagenome]